MNAAEIVDKLPDGIVILNEAGKIHFSNPAACRLFGRSEEELIGVDFGIPSTGGEMTEVDIPRQDGSIVTAELRAEPVEWDGEDMRLVSLRDITERKEMQKDLQYLTYHDQLTGLFNRTYFEAESRRLNVKRQHPITLIMVDVNGLKEINDNDGHLKGDELLKKAADILRQSCREEEILVRWGGDEFIILVPEAGNEIAEKMCKRIRNNCSQSQQSRIPVSLAVGYATKQTLKKSIDELLTTAESRMYEHKYSFKREEFIA